jgi:predicted HD phosphohydrolase
VPAELPALQLAERPATVSYLAEPDGAIVIPVDAALLADLGHLPAAERERAEQQRERLERRRIDHQLVQQFAADNFASPEYQLFEFELIRYALTVLHAWMINGRIFAMCAARGRGLNPSDWIREQLRRDPVARESLANEVIARALPKFRERALRGGGWRPDGGAAITTYFVGALIQELPNVYRSWKREEMSWYNDQLTEYKLEQHRSLPDPAAGPVQEAEVLQLFADFDTLQQDIWMLVAAGASQEAIAEKLGLTSPRAVEGRVRRIREELKRKEVKG